MQLLSIAPVLSMVTVATAQGCSPEVFVVDGEAHNNLARDGKKPIERLTQLLKDAGVEKLSIQLFDRQYALLNLAKDKAVSEIKEAASAIAAPNALILLHKSAFAPEGSTTQIEKLKLFLKEFKSPLPFVVLYSRSGEANLKELRTKVEPAAMAGHIEIVGNKDGQYRWSEGDHAAADRLRALVKGFLKTCTLESAAAAPK